ncbi:MAG: hypothetical protein HY399_05905, partial [Elusimicrobia bacterium]|nr:hypothetical protein [Elusimicrobiota bacterium]
RSAGTIKGACEAIGIARSTFYRWKQEDKEFHWTWLDADENLTDKLEDAAVQRALNGSDVLLIFLLKARRSKRYRDGYSEQDDLLSPFGSLNQLEPVSSRGEYDSCLPKTEESENDIAKTT